MIQPINVWYIAFIYLCRIRKQHRYQSEVQAALLDELILDLYQQGNRIISS